MIYNFTNLLDNLDNVALSELAPGTDVEWLQNEFLAHAEHRYKLWLDVMDQVPQLEQEAFDPPWYVLLEEPIIRFQTPYSHVFIVDPQCALGRVVLR
jgi:hypothetical protein